MDLPAQCSLYRRPTLLGLARAVLHTRHCALSCHPSSPHPLPPKRIPFWYAEAATGYLKEFIEGHYLDDKNPFAALLEP